MKVTPLDLRRVRQNCIVAKIRGGAAIEESIEDEDVDVDGGGGIEEQVRRRRNWESKTKLYDMHVKNNLLNNWPK